MENCNECKKYNEMNHICLCINCDNYYFKEKDGKLIQIMVDCVCDDYYQTDETEQWNRERGKLQYIKEVKR